MMNIIEINEMRMVFTIRKRKWRHNLKPKLCRCGMALFVLKNQIKTGKDFKRKIVTQKYDPFPVAMQVFIIMKMLIAHCC